MRFYGPADCGNGWILDRVEPLGFEFAFIVLVVTIETSPHANPSICAGYFADGPMLHTVPVVRKSLMRE
jgi:hypothetical protein